MDKAYLDCISFWPTSLSFAIPIFKLELLIKHDDHFQTCLDLDLLPFVTALCK